MATLMLIVAAWSAYGYWRTTRQTELARQLGEEIRDVEWLFRAAQMSPLHPIEPQKQQVRQVAARIEQIMREAGSLAFGPGQFALGRSYLTLGESATALQHLNRAWDAGYRTADVATALGLAHDDIFRVEFDKAQRIDSDADRARRGRELEVAHRDPALRFLQAGRSSSIVPHGYIDALIASHRGDTAGAIARADAAARETPWLFEARVLPGDLEFREAVRLYLRGEVANAGQHATEADRYYADAERIAPSAIDADRGRCAVAGLVLHMTGHRLAADPAAALQRADTSCARALVVEPESAGAYRLYAEAVQSWATLNVKRGTDPGDAYDKAARLAERALLLSSADVEARVALADVFLNRAWWESKTDKDPRAAVDRAVETYEKALTLDPRNLAAVDNLGQALLLRSRFELAQGLDASDTQDRAVAAFQKGLNLDPSHASGFRTLESAAVARANEQARRGANPAPGLEQALRFIEGLGGDRTLPTRAEAINTLRARLNARDARSPEGPSARR